MVHYETIFVKARRATARSGKTVEKMENNSKFERNIDGHGKCRSIVYFEIWK